VDASKLQKREQPSEGRCKKGKTLDVKERLKAVIDAGRKAVIESAVEFSYNFVGKGGDREAVE